MEKKIITEQVGRFKVVHYIPVRTKEEEESINKEILKKIYNMISNNNK